MDSKICDLRHEQNEKDHQAIRTYIKAVHEGDERFLDREVQKIAKEFEKMDQLERRVLKLEKWKIYTVGFMVALSTTIPLLIKYIPMLLAL